MLCLSQFLYITKRLVKILILFADNNFATYAKFFFRYKNKLNLIQSSNSLAKCICYVQGILLQQQICVFTNKFTKCFERNILYS